MLHEISTVFESTVHFTIRLYSLSHGAGRLAGVSKDRFESEGL